MITIQATHAIGNTGTYPFTVADHFDSRYGHSSVVLGSDIYVIGGYDGTRCKEVWKSDKSETSFLGELTKEAEFPARSEHSSVVVSSYIYLIGGQDTKGNPLDDVWKSNDGITWVNVRT